MTETGSGVVYDGVPLDGVEVRIDDGAEVWLRGPMLMRCYRDGSRPFDADGWLPTGDLGRWLDDGRLHVDGRRGDLIITGGENVWPEAVEAILTSHPAVADAMVHGVDDDEWGQVVEAVIVPRRNGADAGDDPGVREGVTPGVPGTPVDPDRRRAPPHLPRQTPPPREHSRRMREHCRARCAATLITNVRKFRRWARRRRRRRSRRSRR